MLSLSSALCLFERWEMRFYSLPHCFQRAYFIHISFSFLENPSPFLSFLRSNLHLSLLFSAPLYVDCFWSYKLLQVFWCHLMDGKKLAETRWPMHNPRADVSWNKMSGQQVTLRMKSILTQPGEKLGRRKIHPTPIAYTNHYAQAAKKASESNL